MNNLSREAIRWAGLPLRVVLGMMAIALVLFISLLFIDFPSDDFFAVMWGWVWEGRW